MGTRGTDEREPAQRDQAQQWLWDKGDYEQMGSQLADKAVQLVEVTDARVGGLAGNRVLDLACGNGNVAIAAARRGAEVTGVDLGARLLAEARQKAESAGVEVDFVLANAMTTGLPDQGLDIVVSSFGIIFLPDQPAAMTEFARLLRPGGTLGWTAWVEQPDNPFGRPFEPYLPAPDPARPTIHQWADLDVVRPRLERDFTDVEVEEHEHVWHGPDIESVLALLTASPQQVAAMEAIPPEHHPAVREAFRAVLQDCLRPDGSFAYPNRYVVITATRR